MASTRLRTTLLVGSSSLRPDGTARPAGMDAAPIGGETKEFDSKLRLTVIE